MKIGKLFTKESRPSADALRQLIVSLEDRQVAIAGEIESAQAELSRSIALGSDTKKQRGVLADLREELEVLPGSIAALWSELDSAIKDDAVADIEADHAVHKKQVAALRPTWEKLVAAVREWNAAVETADAMLTNGSEAAVDALTFNPRNIVLRFDATAFDTFIQRADGAVERQIREVRTRPSIHSQEAAGRARSEAYAASHRLNKPNGERVDFSIPGRPDHSGDRGATKHYEWEQGTQRSAGVPEPAGYVPK